MKSIKVSRLDGAGEVGQKKAGAFEDADEVEGAVGIVGVDAGADLGDAVLNLAFGDQGS